MKKTSKKKWILIVIIIALIAGLIFLFLRPKELPPKIVETSKLTKGDIESIVEVQGNVTAEDSAEITSPYNYEVIQINVKEGDTVAKGQVLAVLDAKALQDEIALLQKDIESDVLRVNEAYDAVDNIYNSTQSLELNLENAKIALNQSIENADKKKQLLDAGAIPQVEYDQALNAKEQAQIAYNQAQESLKKGSHDIQSAIEQATPKQSSISMIEGKRMSLAQKREKLKKLQITSPINGTVTRVYAKIGRYAQDTENHKAMFIIEDDSKKYITAKVGEYDISRVKEGQNVSISAEVLDNDTLKGRVNRISPTGEKSQTGNNIVVPVKILITQNDPRLITGVTAKAKISIQKQSNVFKIPFDAIFSQDGKDYFYTIDEESKLKKIEVKKGLESDFDTAISSPDLKEGMIVVQAPDETYLEGDKVMDSSEMPQKNAEDKKDDEKVDDKNSQETDKKEEKK